MNLPDRQIITLERSDGVSIRVAEPSVAQIEAMIRLEPDSESAEKESQRALIARSMKQCRVLITPTAPRSANPLEWLRWWKQRREISAFIAGLSYGAFASVYQVMQFACSGVDVVSLEELSDQISESLKKKQDSNLSPTKSSKTSAPSATSSQTTSD